MSYIVTLQPSRTTDHLKAVCDGPYGVLNCQFPMEIMGISRKDFSNSGVQFEVKNVTFMDKPSGRSAGFYRVAPRDIIRVIPTSSETPKAKTDTPIEPKPTTVTSTKSAADIPDESTLAKRKATAIGISDDDTDFFAESLMEMNNMKDKFENSPLVKRMREFKHLKAKKEQDVQEKLMKNKMTVFNLNESLFEAAQVPMIDFAGKKYTLSQVDSPEVFQMINTPVFNDGMPKLETWILIKLYEATIDPGTRYTDIAEDGTKGVARNELLRRVGTAREAASQTSTYFNAYKVLGLAYLKKNVVYPGPNLEGWIYGDSEVSVPEDDPEYDAHIKKYEKYPNGYDLSKFFGMPDLEKKTPCATKRTKANDATGEESEEGGFTMPGDETTKKKSSPKDLFPDLDIGGPDDLFNGIAEKPSSTIADRKAKAVGVDDDFFEAFDPDSKRDLYASSRMYDRAKTEEYRTIYRETLNLDEDFQFTEDSLDDGTFTHTCNLHGWNPEYAKNRLLGR